MKQFLPYILFIFLLLSSCSNGIPLVTGPANNNKTFEVEYLFEHDGCKVYRFYDMGNYVYFSNCKGETIAIANDSTKHRVNNTTDVFFDPLKE